MSDYTLYTDNSEVLLNIEELYRLNQISKSEYLKIKDACRKDLKRLEE